MEIQLGGKRQGITMISPEDYPFLSMFAWYLTEKGYVRGKVDGKKVSMHGFIMGEKYEEEMVDHKNGIRHDNRRENLVISDRFKNAQNRKIRVDKKTSSYLGIYFDSHRKKFVARCVVNRISYNIGVSINEIEAAELYDLWVFHENLNHKKLNFPEKYEEYLEREYIPPKKRIKNNSYIGVAKDSNKFRAHIMYNNKRIIIMRSSDPVECALAYDQYIIDHNIPKKKLNFPENHPNYVETLASKTLCEDVNDGTVKLLINGHLDKDIFLDKDDYDKVKHYATHISNGYVMICLNDRETGIHRFLKNVTNLSIFVDHIDGNSFNNKQNNLRLSNKDLNAHNKSKQEGTSSKFIGVTFIKSCERWQCKIINKYKVLLQKRHDNEEYAARMRDLYILINLKDQHYKLNFEWNESEIEKWREVLGI